MRNQEQKFWAMESPSAGSEDFQKSEEQKKVSRSSEDPYIVIGEKSVSYLGVEVPKGEGGRLVPKTEEFKEEYFYLEGHITTMREVATALLLNKPILLEGGTGVYNKTTTIARMCRDLNLNYCKVNFDRETEREDVIGGHTLKIDENGKEKLEWYDGDLMYAIRNGGVAFLDEYNRQSKLAGVINPIIDAILNGRKEITNPYNENERVRVHSNFRLVAAQNPPGFEEGHEYTDRNQLPAETFGRWIYRKLPIEYSEEEQNKLLAGVIGEKVDVQLPESEFRHTGEGLPVRELAEIPGMTHWRKNIIDIVRVLEAKSSGAKRELAKNQRQNLYFNPRLIMSTIPQYIARFYRGDINETVKNAFETCVIGMYSSEDDRQKVRLMLDQALWKPPAVDSKRKGAERKSSKETKPENQGEAKEKTEAEELLGKTEEEIKAMEATLRKKRKEILGESFESTISAIYKWKDKKGKEVAKTIELDFETEISSITDFYKKHGIDLPADFAEQMQDIWQRNTEAMTEAIKDKGFDKVLFLPENLPNLADLEAKMTDGYEKEKGNKTFWGIGADQITETSRSGARIILVHEAPDLTAERELQKTLGKEYGGEKENGKDNKAEDFIKNGEALTLSEYLVLQRSVFEKTGVHLDGKKTPKGDYIYWTWLPGSRGGSYVVCVHWDPGDGRLDVGADAPGKAGSDPSVGCRLSRCFQ